MSLTNLNQIERIDYYFFYLADYTTEFKYSNIELSFKFKFKSQIRLKKPNIKVQKQKRLILIKLF